MTSISRVRLMDWRPFVTRKPKPEQTLCTEFASQLRALTLEGKMLCTWTHVPNEIGWSNSRAAQIIYAAAKAMGMIVGAPDYVFLASHGSLALEAKSKTGRQHDRQVDFEAWCGEQNVPYEIFRTVEDGMAILRKYGMIK